MCQILLVDDYIDLLNEHKKTLEEAGNDYEVVAVATFDNALQVLEKRRFDLAIIDLMLEKRSGIELVQIIKRRYKIPCIIYTAHTDKVPEKTLYESGADRVIHKPCELQVFLEAIDGFIDPQCKRWFAQFRGLKLKQLRPQFIRQAVTHSLDATNGAIGESAKLLGITRQCLRRIMKRLDIQR